MTNFCIEIIFQSLYSSPIYGYFVVIFVNKSYFMVNVVSRTFPLDLMMKPVHFQVKKRLSFELQNVAVGLRSAVGLSAYPPLSADSARLVQRRIWQSISIKAAC